MSKNRKICDIYLKINRFAIDLNLKLLHNTIIETQKRGKTAMQIKITDTTLKMINDSCYGDLLSEALKEYVNDKFGE